MASKVTQSRSPWRLNASAASAALNPYNPIQAACPSPASSATGGAQQQHLAETVE